MYPPQERFTKAKTAKIGTTKRAQTNGSPVVEFSPRSCGIAQLREAAITYVIAPKTFTVSRARSQRLPDATSFRAKVYDMLDSILRQLDRSQGFYNLIAGDFLRWRTSCSRKSLKQSSLLNCSSLPHTGRHLQRHWKHRCSPNGRVTLVKTSETRSCPCRSRTSRSASWTRLWTFGNRSCRG